MQGFATEPEALEALHGTALPDASSPGKQR